MSYQLHPGDRARTPELWELLAIRYGHKRYMWEKLPPHVINHEHVRHQVKMFSPSDTQDGVMVDVLGVHRLEIGTRPRRITCSARNPLCSPLALPYMAGNVIFLKEDFQLPFGERLEKPNGRVLLAPGTRVRFPLDGGTYSHHDESRRVPDRDVQWGPPYPASEMPLGICRTKLRRQEMRLVRLARVGIDALAYSGLEYRYPETDLRIIPDDWLRQEFRKYADERYGQGVWEDNPWMLQSRFDVHVTTFDEREQLVSFI